MSGIFRFSAACLTIINDSCSLLFHNYLALRHLVHSSILLLVELNWRGYLSRAFFCTVHALCRGLMNMASP